jgi:response regulator RpfG family c-di-GMP phosphodiesterase
VTPQLLEMIGLASILHDVGKVATPDHILLKPGIHTPEERAEMQQHAAVGAASWSARPAWSMASAT